VPPAAVLRAMVTSRTSASPGSSRRAAAVLRAFSGELGLGGAAYEIDLSAKNARAFRAQLAPFAEHARKAGRQPAGRAARTAAGRRRSGEIRAWAREHGIAVSDRGRIPASVVGRYQAAAKRRLHRPAMAASAALRARRHGARPVALGSHAQLILLRPAAVDTGCPAPRGPRFLTGLLARQAACPRTAGTQSWPVTESDNCQSHDDANRLGAGHWPRRSPRNASQIILIC
jgi:hypothetical protein